MKKLHLLMLCLAALAFCRCDDKRVTVGDLTVEMLENPVGLDERTPRFGWQLRSDLRDVAQTSYRIVVAGSENDLKKEQNLIWDSGEVPSGESVWVEYGGPQLESRKDYFWKVRVTTNTGDETWSEPARWSMALLDDSDWQAGWIGIDSALNATDRMEGDSRLAARYLRKPFDVEGKVKNARLYISGLGLYECYINGKRVGESVLAPTATDYSTNVPYNTFDVREFIKDKQNAIGVTLGNGRFFAMRLGDPSAGLLGSLRQFGFPKLLAQLEIEYENGERQVVVTDTTWRLTTDGPIIANNEFDGEEYDASKELGKWSEAGYDDSAWMNACSVGAPEGALHAQRNPNIRVMEEIDPVAISQLNDSTYILDMGQNMVGWLNVTLKGEKGEPVRLRFAETLKPDGSLYMDNLRGAKVTDVYIPAGDDVFSWEPRFTYHGFRFVEITGLNYKPELKSFVGKVVYDDMKTIGRFETSDPTINQVFKNAYWGIRGNYRSMPTDCPQRDERMGWLGDRAMECIGESFMFRQALLYEKWARDIRDSQLPDGMIPDLSPTYWPFYSENVTYPAAYLCVVDMLYNQYGDEKAVREHYPAMKKWIDYANERLVENDIVVKDVYGDWCMPPESPELIHSQDPARVTDGRLVGTSFFYRLLNMMARFAAVAGHEEDIPAYLEQAARVKDAYNRMFLNPETGQYANNTVSAGLLSLVQGLVPDTLKQKVFDELVRRTEVDFDSHVSTGMIGMQFMMRGLSRYGRPDLALTLATNRTYPSWGYMIDRGATTIWELWNGDTADPAMNSGNHLMQLGDLIAWDWENLAGIQADPAAPGFKHILMKPDFPQGLEWVDASYESMYGTIGSHWKRTGGGLSWSVEIPANTTATLRVPASDVSQVEADGKPLAENPALTDVRASDGFVTFEAGSGSYRFLVGK
ncbi:MAG: glycoside hydrolase family 78 protein [Alistipes ihumii]